MKVNAVKLPKSLIGPDKKKEVKQTVQNQEPQMGQYTDRPHTLCGVHRQQSNKSREANKIHRIQA